uniref:Mitochondrial import inner membrane translocase subunit TIM44 n=1 Tax=Lepisosteus oculatus TaxID=7918 RepID=W5MAA0_LEPOC
MAASLCQCYRLCARRSLLLLSSRPCVSSFQKPHVYRICGSPAASPQVRYASQGGGGRKGFLSEFVDGLKQELSKNKEMKENIRKFREEAKKLEESEFLPYVQKTIESETVKTSEVLRKKFGEISETVKEGLEEVSRSDLGKKIKEGVEEATKTAKHSAESVSRSGEKLGKSGAFRAISQQYSLNDDNAKKNNLFEHIFFFTTGLQDKNNIYSMLETRAHRTHCYSSREAMGVVLHKDSKWYQQWKDFKDNNVVFNRFFEMKMKYDESDNAFIRASRAVTDKVTDLIGGLFSKTEMSEVLTEILKVDPGFDKDSFLKQCEQDIIPNILEAMIRGDLEVLKDWCYEATYSQLAHPIQQAKAMGLQFHSKILDIDNIDLAMGKMMEQGPVLIITFQAQLVMVIRSPKGEVVEGDPEKVLRMMYVWALCRDQDELNPYAAWRLLDISASSTEQIL